MTFDTKLNLNSNKFQQENSEILSLSGTNRHFGSMVIESEGNLQIQKGNITPLNILTGDTNGYGGWTSISGITTHSLSGHTDVLFTPQSAITSGGTTTKEILDYSLIEYHTSTGKWENVENMWYFDSENNIIRPLHTNVDVQLGMIDIAENGGKLIIADMPVTSGSTNNTENSYIFQINNNDVLRIYSIADGIGGVKDKSMVLDGDHFYVGEPEAYGSWRFCLNSTNELVFEKYSSSGWEEKGKFTE